jgi:exosortase A
MNARTLSGITWSSNLAMLMLALASVFVVYWPSYLSLIQKWYGDAAFSHGFLILPIVAWLIWRRKHELALHDARPSAWGLLAVLASTLAWAIARGSGVLVIEQLAVVAFIPSLVLATLGWPLTRVLLFPLLFLFFMVPFGRGLVPALMQVTADFSTLLLQWSGVPVFRSHMFISIPSGDFEVARACSGLNYFITSLVLGVLYAYLYYKSWRKRIVCVAAFIVIPIVLNGLRVYITILVSHWTEMRYGPGDEHVTFGRIFFVVMMLALFWIGRRWHDEVDTDAVASLAQESRRAPSTPWKAWWPLPLALALALLAPTYVANAIATAREHLADHDSLVALPPAAAGWQGPTAHTDSWRPLYRGGLVERQARFTDATNGAVDVFVAVYGLGTTVGAEMISYNNVLSANEHKSLASVVSRRVALPDGSTLDVREARIVERGESLRVWYWFVVGDTPVTGEFAAKALEAIAFVTRSADSERIVTLSTPWDDDSGERLEAFVQAHGACVVQGFSPAACR